MRLLRPELLSAALSPPAYLSSLNDSNAELPSVFALKVISKNDVVMRNRASSLRCALLLFCYAALLRPRADFVDRSSVSLQSTAFFKKIRITSSSDCSSPSTRPTISCFSWSFAAEASYFVWPRCSSSSGLLNSAFLLLPVYFALIALTLVLQIR